ncbi:sce7726 family protein [Saccharopolyspora sp. NFXS83]|uniref:sce7726 family protein n=1 Tax=Saccharopolyspora sp. NFXS83 TaxID=2993560 RepID=UPI003A4DD2F7
MRDRDVRTCLTSHLRAEHPESDTLFVDELDLGGLVRVDLAVVNGSFWGYEIKSARDNLRRLPSQVQVYSRTLDRAALVVAECHATKAIEFLPNWWEVIIATENQGSIQLNQLRRGTQNPVVDPWSLVQLLWREEALDELQKRGIDRGVRSKPRREIWRRMTEELDTSTIQETVRNRLRSRIGWRAGQ